MKIKLNTRSNLLRLNWAHFKQITSLDALIKLSLLMMKEIKSHLELTVHLMIEFRMDLII